MDGQGEKTGVNMLRGDVTAVLLPVPLCTDGIKRFSYKHDNVELITGAKPISLFFKGKEFPLDGKWENLPEKICFALETLWPCKLHDIVGRGNVPNMGLNPIGLRKGKFVKGAGIWYETNCASREFIKQTRSLCRLFGVALENVSITFVKTSQQSFVQSGDSEKKPLQQTVGRAKVPSHSYESQIAELLEAEFTNGVRPGSIIDRNKIRKLYRQHFGEDLPEDFAFATVLPKIGVVHDGKVFPRPSSKGGGWRKLIEKLVNQGNLIFQFSRLMELNSAEFMANGILSATMLRDTILRDADGAFECDGDFFIPSERGSASLASAIVSLIMEDSVLVEMKTVAKRLPYVNESSIREYFREDKAFIWNDSDSYAIVGRIEFDDGEVARGIDFCRSAIEEDGFFSLKQLCLDDSAAMNDQRLSDGALRRAFCLRFLADSFDVHGQIVCARGGRVDGQVPLHAFLREHSDVTLDQIETVAKEYNIAPWLALRTAHEEMARVARDRFVAPGMVPFDVTAIDAAIANVCEGVPVPFGALFNLSDFPAVPGWPWNEYLIEAFLRRSSIEFRLLSPSVPARDVSGAVVPRNFGDCSAEDAFATIALRCGVAAEAEEVGDFLVATQCILRRSAKTLGAVASRMKELGKH